MKLLPARERARRSVRDVVSLRGWQRDDLGAMAAMINARVADEGSVTELVTETVLASVYDHLIGSDPERDIVVAVDDTGALAGYARVGCEELLDGTRNYVLAFEGHGEVARQMFRWAFDRAGVRAADDPHPNQRFDAWAADGTERQQVILDAGCFEAFGWSATMVRPHLDDVPALALPDGVATRPVEPAHLRAIWEADVEAFRDHGDEPERANDDDWQRFLDEAGLGAELWQIAWDRDGVAGQVRTRVTPGEAESLGRRRAWTENISTRRDRRGQGIASALIAASLRQLAELGFDEAALGVDLHNPTGALSVYERLGYHVVQRYTSYRYVP